MAVEILSYSPTYYDTLPDIMEAGEVIRGSGAHKAMDEVIGQIFMKYGMERKFGIILLHNHFSMSPAEKLVIFGNVAVPWDTDSGSAGVENITGASWRFTERGVAPYEFIYAPPSKLSIPKLSVDQHRAFLADLGGALVDRNLTDILGLCILDDRDIDAPATLEITSGRANITLDVDIDGDEDTGNIQAIWQFGSATDPLGQPIVFKKYKTSCKIRTVNGEKKHVKIHQTTNK